MEGKLPGQIERYIKLKKFITGWKSFVCALVFVAVFFTVKAMTLPAITASGTTYCGKAEHTHNDDCMRIELACQCQSQGEPGTEAEQEQTEQEQIHGTECYVKVLECRLEEHIHTKLCYSNKNADVETADDWEQTLPQELTGNWAEDLLSVAASQLGYKESTENYIVTDDNKTKGYTRYGDWYGDAYGHWCAMYVSFCLHYAGVDSQLMPQDSNCQNWIQTLSKEEYDLYRESAEYEPVPGDLIFFNWDADAASDHVGIVTELLREETDAAKKQIKTIEGNAGDDEVIYRSYDMDDERIMGYGILPKNPELEEIESNMVFFTDEDEFLLQTEGAAPLMTFALNADSSANSSISTYANDAYAPEGIELTGSWAADVAAVANTLISYEESDGISKIDQWAGGDGTGAWNVNFINYCLYYAGVDKESIPWDESYSLSDFQNALDQQGLLKGLGETGLNVGDITICTTSWSSNELVLGIVTSHNPNNGTYQISFGDKDGSGRVVSDEYYADWYSRVMAVLRLSGKTAIDSGGLEIEITHNIGDNIEDVVITTENNNGNAAVWEEGIREAVGSESTMILTNHFLSIIFKNAEGETVIPSGNIDLVINFDTPIQAEIPEEVSASNVKWIYKLIDQNNEVIDPGYAATTYTDIDQNIKRVKLRYEEALVYAFTLVQADYSDITCITVSDMNDFLTQMNSSQNENIEIILEADLDATETDAAVEIGFGRNVVLDLNGHKIYTADTLISIDGGSFTLKDSMAAGEYEPNEIGPVSVNADTDYDEEPVGDMVGRQAVYDRESHQLIYYVTESHISNQNTGATNESMTEHRVSIQGAIDGSAGTGAAVHIKSGSMNLNSGAIVSCNDCGIYQTGGMFYMYGGYICGNRSAGSGGGINSTGDGTLGIKGGVIAANEAAIDGGAIYLEADSLYLYGGILSGNTCIEAGSGGGIFARGTSTLSVEGGYITNNRCSSEDYNAGGGGIFTTGQAVLKLKGGYITGNYVGGGGGGIRSSANQMIMSGGYICSNYAETAEGGGISLCTPCAGTITAGFINNNVTNTHEHWGGGGLFCANGDNDAGTYASFYITNALVTENNAGGYGGGVAGCSTGRTYICAKEGGAIFDNKAGEPDKVHLSGGTSWKSEDHLYATSSFLQYGYNDYFSAFNSIVGGTMLGDCPANWTGSVDGVPIQTQPDDTLISSYFMGLNSNPNVTGRQAAESLAKVYINGNESFTHGGGVLCNGYLLIGEIKEVEVYSRLRIHGTKALQSTEGDAPALEAGQFKFYVVNTDTGRTAATGTNNENGEISFDHMIPYTEEGVYRYRLYEDPEEGAGGIIMDTTEYEIMVTVEKIDCGTIQENVKKYRYEISDLKVIKKDSSGSETVRDFNPIDKDSLPVELTVTDGATFTNIVTPGTNVSVQKIWEGGSPDSGTAVQVQLYRNGEPYGAPVELTEANSWFYDWGQLPLSEIIDETEYKYTYSIQEVNVPAGYLPEYSVGSGTAKNEFWVPVTEGQLADGKEYMIVSPDRTYAFTPGSVNTTLTENDKTPISLVSESVTDENGVTYDHYVPVENVTENMIFQVGYTGWGNQVLKHKELPGNPMIGMDVYAHSSSDQIFDIQMRTDKAFFMYLNEIQIGNKWFDGAWHEMVEKYFALEYQSGKFVMVYRDSAQASRVPHLYTKAYSVGAVGLTFTITNKKIDVTQQRYSIEITKMSEKDANLLLTGAHFELYEADASGNPLLDGEEMIPLSFRKTTSGRYEYMDSTDQTEDIVTEGITVFGGKLVFANLPQGNYILRETIAPNGYDVIEDRVIRFDSTSGISMALNIADSPLEEDGFILPEAGGIGTGMYIYGGLLIILAAVLLLYKNTRKRA